MQSNISAHVARLERELGLTLIDRATTEPTYEGRAVLERARRIETEFEALDSDVASLRDEISGHVRLGLIGTTARWLAPPLLTRIGERYPEVSVVILDATTSSLVLNLLSGTIDLAVLNLPVVETELVVEPLFDEDRLLIVPKGHPLFDHDSVDLSELVHHQLLLEAPGTPFRDLLDAAGAAQGSASSRRPSSTGCACSHHWSSAGTAPASFPHPLLPSASAATGGGCRSPASPADPWGWSADGAACCPLPNEWSPRRSTPRSATAIPLQQESTRRRI